MTTTVAHLLALLLVATGPGSSAPAPPPAAQRAPAAGVWPLQPSPEVVAGFRPPATAYGAGHRGVDLAGRPGQVVRAAAAGRVTYAGSLAGRGVVVVTHGATRTTYEPVRATVELGATVAAGDRIGRLETVGSHCPPAACLHWGLIEGDTYLDPLTLVGAGPVRLVPLDGLPTGGSSWPHGRAPVAAPSPGSPGLLAGPAAFGRLRDTLARRTADERSPARPQTPPGPPAPPGPARPV